MKQERSVVLIPVLYLVIIVAVNILGVFLYSSFNIADEELRFIRLGSITNLLFYGSLFVLYIVLFLPAWKRTIIHFFRNKTKQGVVIALGTAGMFAAIMILGSVYLFLGIEDQAENQAILEAQLNGPMFDRVVLVVFAVLLAPFVEEMMFRLAGFRLLKQLKWLPTWGVIALTAIIFGSIHVLGDNYIQVIYYAGLGVVLGTIYHYSNNIIAPIVVHMVFNLFVTITMFVSL
jgi:membrane protease YdiL (CAAX protease family)